MLIDRCGECPACKHIEYAKPTVLACANPPFSHATDGVVQTWNQILFDNPCAKWTDDEVRVSQYQALQVSQAIRPRILQGKLRLTIDLTYNLEDTPIGALKDRLEYLVQHAAGDGYFTGDTSATVDEWSHEITQGSFDVEYIQSLAALLGTNTEDLDELVHDVASKPASAVNNGGLDEQLEFLVQQLGAKEVEQALLRDARDRQHSDDGPIRDGTQGGSAMTGREH